MGLASFVTNLVLLGVGFYFTYTVLLPKLASLPQGVPAGGGGQFVQNATLMPGMQFGGSPQGGLSPEGVRLVHRTTGKSVAIGKGSNHRNGQRYNVNHSFRNYMIVAYLKTSSGQTAIGIKTDGPNHGSCKSKPKCLWIDPDIQLDDLSVVYGAEYPHPKSNKVPCPSCRKAGVNVRGKWVGVASVAYGPDGNRWHELWVDPGGLDASGKPANRWTQLLKENYTKYLPSDWRNRQLPTGGRGLEAEIRMRGARSGVDMKFAHVFEIVPPIGAGAIGRPVTSGLGDININVNILGAGNRVLTAETGYAGLIKRKPYKRLNNEKPGFKPSIVDDILDKIIADEPPIHRRRFNQPILIRR